MPWRYNPLTGDLYLDEVGSGSGGSSYTHTQSSAASTWTINHNLGYIPSTELFNSGSVEVEGEVSHPSNNQTIVSFATPVSGFARLN